MIAFTFLSAQKTLLTLEQNMMKSFVAVWKHHGRELALWFVFQLSSLLTLKGHEAFLNNFLYINFFLFIAAIYRKARDILLGDGTPSPLEKFLILQRQTHGNWQQFARQMKKTREEVHAFALTWTCVTEIIAEYVNQANHHATRAVYFAMYPLKLITVRSTWLHICMLRSS